MDWFDPNTWKLPAELIGYAQAIILGIVAIVGAIATILLKPLRWFRSRTKNKVEQKSAPITFVPNDLHCRWSEGRLNEHPTTTVHGRWHVTNACDSDVMILKARLAKHTAMLSQVTTAQHLDDERQIFGNYPVRSHQMTEVMAVLNFFPAIHRAREPIIIDVIFTDNFANEHRVRTQFSNIQRGPSPQLLGRLDRCLS